MLDTRKYKILQGDDHHLLGDTTHEAKQCARNASSQHEENLQGKNNNVNEKVLAKVARQVRSEKAALISNNNIRRNVQGATSNSAMAPGRDKNDAKQ